MDAKWPAESIDAAGHLIYGNSPNLFFGFRSSNDVAIARRWDHYRLPRRQHDVVTTDDVRKLIEVALPRPIDRLIAFNIAVAVVLYAGTGRNQPPHNHVLLQAAQVVDPTGDCRFGKNARGFLERCRRDERISRKRSFGDTQQQRLGLCDFAIFLPDTLVLVLETEAIDLLFQQELGVADFLDLHPA